MTTTGRASVEFDRRRADARVVRFQLLDAITSAGPGTSISASLAPNTSLNNGGAGGVDPGCPSW
jgi:hypothetical protein